MAPVPRRGSALALIVGICLAAMAHTMGCGASGARARLRLRSAVQNRPRRLDGSKADGIGIGGLSVQESTTPSPWKKTPPAPSCPPTPSTAPRCARLRSEGACAARLPAPAPPAEQFVPIRCAGGAWMTGFQAQVVHRHARHTAPFRSRPLFWAMAGRVCWRLAACRRLHCPK